MFILELKLLSKMLFSRDLINFTTINTKEKVASILPFCLLFFAQGVNTSITSDRY